MRLYPSAAVLVIAAVVAGCASHPRGFVPIMAAMPADQAAFETAFNVCSRDVAGGRRESFRSGRGDSVLTGGAIGGAAAVVTAGSAAAGAGLLAAPAAAAGLAIGAVVFAPIAIYGASLVQRANKEREIQRAMTTCLREEGYGVDDWRVLSHGEEGLASPTRAAPVVEPSR